jgi:hypothetical protein
MAERQPEKELQYSLLALQNSRFEANSETSSALPLNSPSHPHLKRSPLPSCTAQPACAVTCVRNQLSRAMSSSSTSRDAPFCEKTGEWSRMSNARLQMTHAMPQARGVVGRLLQLYNNSLRTSAICATICHINEILVRCLSDVKRQPGKGAKPWHPGKESI